MTEGPIVGTRCTTVVRGIVETHSSATMTYVMWREEHL
jgi:hypothetical protein